ncbi:hypothetical protein [Bacillus cereus]|uniref:Uncharacterized protein n=1 Tax=Bacillus cereus VD184 TaxID=1053242 RepID=A0A9W5R268_BACCE|nr:hypothetical protein [Bacillus cereus]EOQ04921.1 hypothetical protein IKC_06298 [Bacillus cereus VD184]
MKVIVWMEAFGVSEEEEIEISDPSMLDWEIERFVTEQISYSYEVIEEDEEED